MLRAPDGRHDGRREGPRGELVGWRAWHSPALFGWSGLAIAAPSRAGRLRAGNELLPVDGGRLRRRRMMGFAPKLRVAPLFPCLHLNWLPFRHLGAKPRMMWTCDHHSGWRGHFLDGSLGILVRRSKLVARVLWRAISNRECLIGFPGDGLLPRRRTRVSVGGSTILRSRGDLSVLNIRV